MPFIFSNLHLYFHFHFTRLRFSALFDVFQSISLIVFLMFMKIYACVIFLNEAGPSISSSVVFCSFYLPVHIEALVIYSVAGNKEEKLGVRKESTTQ